MKYKQNREVCRRCGASIDKSSYIEAWTSQKKIPRPVKKNMTEAEWDDYLFDQDTGGKFDVVETTEHPARYRCDNCGNEFPQSDIVQIKDAPLWAWILTVLAIIIIGSYAIMRWGEQFWKSLLSSQ